ncbi:MAG: hypothetical protein JNJ50_27400 [Acidobacteria bacterium]|nr:hypothetical protein [Acidobacteriota bacterium]
MRGFMCFLNRCFFLSVSVPTVAAALVFGLSINNACSSPQKRKGIPITRENDENVIAEVTVHFQLQQHYREVADKRVIFLFMGDNKDASDSFLARMRAGKVLVKKLSQSEIGSTSVKDKVTGEEGVILGVSAVKWITETEVEVIGKILFSRENSLTYLYRLEKERNKEWVVKESKVIGET